VSVTVNPVNDAPVAVPDAYATPEDDMLTIPGTGVLDNDFDIDLPMNTLTVISPPVLSSLGAALNIRTDGSFDYDPTNAVLLQALQVGQSARDEFVYRISDGTGTGTAESNDTTVTITVTGQNDAPTGQDDQYSIPEAQTLVVDVVTGLLGNDSDPENDVISALIVSQPGNGSIALQTNGAFSYTPRANFNGQDTFQYRATDGALSSNVVTVTIDVASVPEPPVAAGDSYETDANMTLDVLPENGVLVNDTDDEGPLTARLINAPNRGSLTLNADGSFEYTPEVGFVGDDSFRYEAVDGEGLASNAANVTIRVNSNALWQNAADPRDVNNDGSVTPQDVLIIINRLNSGPNSDVLDLEITGPPPPFVDVNGDGSVSPSDVLNIINFLNAQPVGEGEGALGALVGHSEGLASQVNFDAFGFLPFHFDGPFDRHQVVGPRRDANVLNEDRYFGQLGSSNVQPSGLATGDGLSRSSHSLATSRVDEILDDLAGDVDGFFADDDIFDKDSPLDS
jgi:VCBS repeat-containing protein